MCLVFGIVVFFVLGIFNMYLINCFEKIQLVLRRTYESAVVLKRTFYSIDPEKDPW